MHVLLILLLIVFLSVGYDWLSAEMNKHLKLFLASFVAPTDQFWFIAVGAVKSSSVDYKLRFHYSTFVASFQAAWWIISIDSNGTFMSSLFSSQAKAWKCETSFKLEKSPATITSSDYKICENLSETFFPVMTGFMHRSVVNMQLRTTNS